MTSYSPLTARIIIICILILLLGGKIWIDSRDISSHQVTLDPIPLQLGTWKGENLLIAPRIIELLLPDEIIFRRYTSNNFIADFYGIFYLSQATNKTFHSPLNCYPGSGWEIVDKSNITVRGKQFPQTSVNATKLTIQKGLNRRYLYYWFSAGEKTTGNEYKNKLLTVYNSLFNGRSDGGLIMVSTPISKADQINEVEGGFIPTLLDSLFENLYSINNL